jgi:hypothetical protein
MPLRVFLWIRNVSVLYIHNGHYGFVMSIMTINCMGHKYPVGTHTSHRESVIRSTRSESSYRL